MGEKAKDDGAGVEARLRPIHVPRVAQTRFIAISKESALHCRR